MKKITIAVLLPGISTAIAAALLAHHYLSGGFVQTSVANAQQQVSGGVDQVRSAERIDPAREAKLAEIRALVARQKREDAEKHKRNVSNYLRFKGWKCGTVVWHKRHDTNRIDLTSNEIHCLERSADGKEIVRAYLVTVNADKWNAAVEWGRFDERDRARISSISTR